MNTQSDKPAQGDMPISAFQYRTLFNMTTIKILIRLQEEERLRMKVEQKN